MLSREVMGLLALGVLWVNALLVAAAAFDHGFTREKWAIYVAGFLFDLVWILSIGRTSYYQKLWDRKLELLQEKHPGDRRFSIVDVEEVEERAAPFMRFIGGVSSRYYLVGTPIVLSVLWCAAFVCYVLL